MEKMNVISKAGGVSDINLLYGRWVREGSQYVERETDLWHPGTRYYIPSDELTEARMRERIAGELMRTGAKGVFQGMSDIRYETVLIPVVRTGDQVMSLTSLKDRHSDIGRMFDHGMCTVKTTGWSWTELDTARLNETGQKCVVLPVNVPFQAYMEKVQQTGAPEDGRVFFMPLERMTCRIDGIEVEWICFNDGSCSSWVRIGDFPEDPVLKEGIFRCHQKSMLVMLTLAVAGMIFLIVEGWIHQNGLGFILYLIFAAVISVICGMALLFVGNFIDSLIVLPIAVRRKKAQLNAMMEYKKQTALEKGFQPVAQYGLKFEDINTEEVKVMVTGVGQRLFL